MKRLLSWFVTLLSFSLFATSLNFTSQEITAGKALLSSNGYIVSNLLGVANFSPELKLPIQIIYKSTNEKTNLLGFAWYSPQLESTAYYDKDGVHWITPWGEKIKFFPKKEKTPKDAIKIPLYEQAQKGREFYTANLLYARYIIYNDFKHGKIE